MPLGSPSIRRIDLAGCVVTACIVAASYAIGLGPLFGAIADRADAADAVQSLSSLSQQAHSDVNRLKREINTLDEQLAGIHRLSDRTQANHTIGLVTEQALKEGLIVESGTANDPIDSDMYAVVPIHLSGKGEFIASARFIHALTEDHADIEVRSFTLTARTDSRGGGSEFSIELAWYVLPE